MPGKPKPQQVPPGFCAIALVAITVIMLCLATGCTSFSAVKVPDFGSDGGDRAGGSGSGNSAGGGSGGGTSNSGGYGGGSTSLHEGETETSTWQATVSVTENERTVYTAATKADWKSGISYASSDEEKTSTLKFQGSFPVVVDHQTDSSGKDVYKMKFIEGGKDYPVSGSYSEHDSVREHNEPYDYYKEQVDKYESAFDHYEEGTIDKTNFDFGFYPDGQMVQLDGRFSGTTRDKKVTSDGEGDYEDTGTHSGAFSFQCHSEDEDEKGHAFERGQRDFRMEGTSYKITCHVNDERVLENDDTGPDTKHSSTTRDITMNVVLDPVPAEPRKLKAVPGGPYTVERGTPLRLDGSKSTGSITKYTWTFTPGAGCPAGLSLDAAELTGSQPSATFLCPVTAKLTVTDGKSSDSATVPVSVTPRSWETPFTISAEGLDTGEMATAPWFNSISGMYEGGASICGLCEGTADESTNLLHPAPKGSSWESAGGYGIREVAEPKAPFDGYWYVTDYKVEMNRKTVVNPYVLPAASGGKELPYTMGFFYQHNLDAKYDVAGYLAGIRQHEKDHADRMKQALQSADPAKEIEKIVEKDKDSVKNTADKKLHETEKLICTKSSDASQPPMAETWTGKLLFPTADTNQWKEGETGVGGHRADAGESCG